MNDWRPALLSTERKRRPEVGDVVALDYRAWAIVHMSDGAMTSEEIAALERRFKPGYRDQHKPYRVTLRRLHGPVHEVENDQLEVALSIEMGAWRTWEVYPEGRVPLCSCCSHPWPCLMVTSAAAAKQQGKLLDEKMAHAQPGCCYSCGELISDRQASVVYPEGNVELPGFPPPAFHLRKCCAGARYEYDKLRTKALPDAPTVLHEESTQKLHWGEP